MSRPWLDDCHTAAPEHEAIPKSADPNQPKPTSSRRSIDTTAFDEEDRKRWLDVKERLKDYPGSFFRKWDVSCCRLRIRQASREDLPELRIALQKEEASYAPRKHLVPYLRARIEALEAEIQTAAGQGE